MRVGVIGASGLVGRNILTTLKNYDNFEIFCYSSKNSAGKIISGHKMIELNEDNITSLDFALFSAGSKISKDYAQNFIDKGAIVIDNSNSFRREKNVPLIVPEINFHEVNINTKLIANPNCSTIQIALPLYILNRINPIKKVIVSTYQSASGAGQKGLEDLDNNTTNKLTTILNDDLIPQIDIALNNNYTLEEDKVRFELRKILNLPKLHINATCVRVPIHYCHGASVYVECKNNVDLNTIEKELKLTKGIKILNNLQNNKYPLTKIAKNTDDIYVGRLREDLDNKKAVCFWVVADNLRKGASTNAIQIMEKIIKTKLL